ncbi:Zinc finger FYVE domain-containing protein 26 [Sarcoptes scabiei]|uniref:Zinc finger FYVE domain-containing protein 26 n=1 Tax=Sarcoptes scabiei TaxID=52283 RepID=A0A834V889_SARSC|nr:Zinc finger FYVE domain-containing protein 26 [Sarcoptes scabiei]
MIFLFQNIPDSFMDIDVKFRPKSLVPLEQCLSKLQQQIELATSRFKQLSFVSELALKNFLRYISITDHDDENEIEEKKEYRHHHRLPYKQFDCLRRNSINLLLSYLVYLFESSSEPEKLWLLHRMIRKIIQFIGQNDRDVNVHLLLEQITSDSDLRRKLAIISDRNYTDLIIVCSFKLKNLKISCEDFYMKIHANEDSDSMSIILDENDYLQSLCTNLRNSLLQDSFNTSIILKILSKSLDDKTSKQSSMKKHCTENRLNCFDKIFQQSLIHAMKNENFPLFNQIVMYSPENIFSEENFIKQIIEFHCNKSEQSSQHDSRLLSLYSRLLFCDSDSIIRSVSRINQENILTDHGKTEDFFNLRPCFISAVCHRKHFLRIFLDNYHNDNHEKIRNDIDMLPAKSQIMMILLSLHETMITNEDLEDLSAKKSKLINSEAELMRSIEQYSKARRKVVVDDLIFNELLCKIRFMFRFADWCYEHINRNKIENFKFRFEIISQLMNGQSPLKLLSNLGFFEQQIRTISLETFKEEIICDNVCDLLSKFDHRMLMIMKGFIVIRWIIFCIFYAENENAYFENSSFQSLLDDLYPIEFRIEILENLFSLLFLSSNDLKSDLSFDSDEEGYLDDISSSIKLEPTTNSKKTSHKNNVEKNPRKTSSSNNFLFPNWLIPKLLDVLRDSLIKANSDLFNSKASIGFETLMNDKKWQKRVQNLKSRVATLQGYVNDAQFRFDVIRPALCKSSSNYKNDLATNDPSSTDFSDSTPKTEAQFQTNEINDEKLIKKETSLISCMLASYSQLLCHTLNDNRIESSRQIAKLFEKDLKDTKPLKELQLLDHFNELHTQVSLVQSQLPESKLNHKSSSFDGIDSWNQSEKIDQIASIGIRSSKIQSLLYETLMKMDQIDTKTKIVLMMDYALTSSPSMEITKSILESVFVHNNTLFLQSKSENFDIIPDFVESYIIDIQKFISNMSQHINIGDVSMSEILNHPIHSTKLFDSQTLIESIENQLEVSYWFQKFFQLQLELEALLFNDDENEQSRRSASKDLQSDIETKSNQLNFYYDRLIGCCPSGKYQYLKALYFYLSKVNQSLLECRHRSLSTTDESVTNFDPKSPMPQASIFSILKQSPSAILCSMVIKNKIPPAMIDDLAQTMKINLPGVLCSVFCPQIPSTFLNNRKVEFSILELCQPSLYKLIESYFNNIETLRHTVLVSDYFGNENFHERTLDDPTEEVFKPQINQDVLEYFHSKCSVLVQILRLLNLVQDNQLVSIESSSPSLKIFSNSPLTNWIEIIKRNFYCGQLDSVLNLAFYARISSGQNIVLKSLEFHASRKNFLQIFRMFDYIDDFSSVLQESFVDPSQNNYCNYRILQNAIYAHLAFIKEDAKYLFQINNDPKMKADLILKMLDSFEVYEETFYATRLIRLGLQSVRNDEIVNKLNASEIKSKLEITLKQIEFYASVGQLTGLKTWKLAKDNLESIDMLAIIRSRKRYSLAIDWYHIKGFEIETTDILLELLIYAYSEQEDYESLEKLFRDFVEESKSINIIAIAEKILNDADDLNLRTFLIDFLIDHYRKNMNNLIVEQYERYRLGVEMVQQLGEKIQKDYIDLIFNPILIIEQLLMNSEIESLEKIINRNRLIKADELLEKYSLKSIYIDIFDSSSSYEDTSDMTVISSESSQTKNIAQFNVPQKIPSKEQWVSDYSKTHCMLCQIVRFSMINRRHHCRRCGRVVCNNCSTNNLLITDINALFPVRVCDDCFDWYNKGRKVSTHSIDSFTADPTIDETKEMILKRTKWKLSLLDDSINQNRRQEFNYESAPSVSLCLAILRLHSNKTKCCKFIIEKICAPLIESISLQNVDSTLLIEMIRSLLISTRLAIEEKLNPIEEKIHNEGSVPGSSSSTAETEQLNLYLDQLDVIRMLINANFRSKEIISYVLNNNIQKLKEKLLEAERFELTIDIAKKYGIESNSIRKAWALICLKNLHFDEARKKFAQYFIQIKRISEKQITLKILIETLSSLNYTPLQAVPLKNKCSLIQKGDFRFLSGSENEQSDDVASIFDSKSVSSKSQEITETNSLKSKIFAEIVYYLETYGSYDDQIKFFIENGYFKDAIKCFIRSQQVQSSRIGADFVQKIFIPSHLNGHLGDLFTAIRICDPKQTILWVCLLESCKYLNKNYYYHSLYKVQIFMNDYLRAAITQINHFFFNLSIEPHQEDPKDSFEREVRSQSSINLPVDCDGFELLRSRSIYLEKARDLCNIYLHNIDFIKIKHGCLVVEKQDVFKQISLIELQIDLLKRFEKISYPISCRLYSVEELEHYLMEWSISERPLFLSAFLLSLLETKLNIKIDRLPYPPTLLEYDYVRKSLITALIILYYDQKSLPQQSGSETEIINRFEDGFRCALRIIEDHQLDARIIFWMASMFSLVHHLESNSSLERILLDLKLLLQMFATHLEANQNEKRIEFEES